MFPIGLSRATKRKGGQSLTTYNYTSNRLTSTTGAEAVTYGYNNNGSVTSAGSPTYVYDKLNRIVKITGITPTDSFAYDGENRRIYANDNGVALVNLYDIFGNLISQYTPGSAYYTSDYVWANGEPRVKLDTLPEEGLGPLLAPPSNPEMQFWYHTDHLGTPQATTDSLREDRWRISTDPFGETVAEVEPNVNNLRFPGQYVDRGSGLNYNRNRFYQPKIGRYYQDDPLILAGAVHAYDYAASNPVNVTDILGLLSQSERRPILVNYAGALAKLAQAKVITDCEALADFVDFVSLYHSGFWDSPSAFVNDISGVLGGVNGPLDLITLGDPSARFGQRGFNPLFVDYQDPRANQVRHFAGFLAAGFYFGEIGGNVAIWHQELRTGGGVFGRPRPAERIEWEDIFLGYKAIDLGLAINSRRGMIPKAGQWIRDNVCQKPKCNKK